MILKFNNFTLDKDVKITYQFNGMQTLEFELFDDEFVKCESSFVYDNNRYLVKSIDNNVVSCELDLSDFRQIFFAGSKSFGSLTLVEVLKKLTNWRVLGSGTKTIRRTLHLEDESALSGVMKVAKLYDCTFEFDVINKVIKIVDEPRSIELIVSKDINLVSIDTKIDTYEHYTRLYCYGKDNVTFAEINDGKEYIEDFSFNNKVIPAVFRDERFTNKDNLKKHCEELLSKFSKPVIEYTVKVIDLSNDKTYHDIKLHDEFILLNPKTKQKEKHRVIELVKYSDNPHLNEITIVNKSKRFSEHVKSLDEKISLEISKNVNDKFKTLFDAEMIKFNERFENLLVHGHKIETNEAIYFVDKLPKEQARNVIKIGVGGIMATSQGWNGNYETAITNDGRLNLNVATVGELNGHYIGADTISADKLTVSAKDELRNGLVTEQTFNEFKVNSEKLQSTFQKEVEKTIPQKITELFEEKKDELKAEPSYVWLQYADDKEGTNMSIDSTNKKYMGIAINKNTETPSTNPDDYSWSLIDKDLNIGGVNLLPYSTFYWEAINLIGKPDNRMYVYKNIINCNQDEDFTLQLNSEYIATIHFIDSENNYSMELEDNLILETGEVRRFKIPAGKTKFKISISHNSRSFLRMDTFGAILQKAKLERGNIKTDWSEAFEDKTFDDPSNLLLNNNFAHNIRYIFDKRQWIIVSGRNTIETDMLNREIVATNTTRGTTFTWSLKIPTVNNGDFYSGKFVRLDVQMKADKNVDVEFSLDNGTPVPNEIAKVTEDYKHYSILVSDGQEDTFPDLIITAKSPCKLYLRNAKVYISKEDELIKELSQDVSNINQTNSQIQLEVKGISTKQSAVDSRIETLKSEVDVTKNEVRLTSTKVNEVVSEVKPDKDFFRSSTLSGGTLNINLTESLPANKYYTVVFFCDRESRFNLRTNATILKDVYCLSGQNAVSFHTSSQIGGLNFYNVSGLTITNIRVYEGNWVWHFNKTTAVNKAEEKAEISVSVKNGIRQTFVTANGKVSQILIDGKGTQIDGGVIVDELYGKTITGGILQGNTKIKIGEYGFMQPITHGLQINAPASYNAQYGVGFQFHGIQNGNIPKGLFIYEDPDFRVSNNISTPRFTETPLLSVKSPIRATTRNGEEGLCIVSNPRINNDSTQRYAVEHMFFDFSGGTRSLLIEGSGSGLQLDGRHYSDVRLKENIDTTNITALDYVNQFNFKKYNWKDGGFFEKLGLIAQDLEKIDSDLVKEDLLDGHLYLNDNYLLMLALKSNQELSVENKVLKDEISIIKKELTDLRKEIRNEL